MRTIALLLLAGFMVLTGIASARAQRVALVVGNSDYLNIPDLANPANDAKLIGETLAGLGFALVGGKAQLDLDKAGLDAAVQDFGRDIQGADVALFYYAGHGVQVRGANYLVPVTANPAREADVDFQMLDSSLVVRQMEGSGARLKLVILDACRNNPFGGRGLRSASSGLAQMVAPEGTLISFATQPGNVAMDGGGANSPYTKALADTIRKPGLDIFRAFNEVGLAVAEATGGQQQPWFQLSPIKGEFFFAGEGAAGKQAQNGAASGDVLALAEQVKKLRDEVAKQQQDANRALQIGVLKPEPSAKSSGCDNVHVSVGGKDECLRAGDVFRDLAEAPEMVVIPAGNFTMGSPDNEEGRGENESPQHIVTIAEPFAVGKFEVTVGQFAAFMKTSGHKTGDSCKFFRGEKWVDVAGKSWRDPGFAQSGSHPVACISFDDAKAYVAWLSDQTGKSYRLLSEAEWEYAARAGTSTPFSTGKILTGDQANFNGNFTYGGSAKGKFREKTTEAGSYKPNAFGLHDMHGNVWEWTEDCYRAGYNNAPDDGSAVAAGTCHSHPLRGGSWIGPPRNLRSASRIAAPAGQAFYNFGIRLARTLR